MVEKCSEFLFTTELYTIRNGEIGVFTSTHHIHTEIMWERMNYIYYFNHRVTQVRQFFGPIELGKEKIKN